MCMCVATQVVMMVLHLSVTVELIQGNYHESQSHHLAHAAKR